MPTSRMTDALAAFAVSLVLLLSTPSTEASRVRPLGLPEMTDRAQRIFQGRCTSAELVVDPATGVRATRLTFEVNRWLKGATTAAPTVTVRMLGDVRRGAKDTWGSMARFEPGEEVILFLDGDSSYGLTSPIGLMQGKLEVVHDKLGRAIAVPPLGVESLVAGAPTGARDLLSVAVQGDGVEAGALLEVVDRIVRKQPFALDLE